MAHFGDNEGWLVNQAGYRVQSHNSSEAGEVSSIVEDKIAPGRLLQPNSTDAEVIINANFRPDDPVSVFDVNDTENTASWKRRSLRRCIG